MELDSEQAPCLADWKSHGGDFARVLASECYPQPECLTVAARVDVDVDTSFDLCHRQQSIESSRTGPDNLKRSVMDWCLAFPDTRTIIDELAEEADVAAARWTSTATPRGTFLGIPATGVTGSG
jgi:hypothetical protein